MGQEGCWGCLFNWDALKGVDDGLELEVFGDFCSDLLGQTWVGDDLEYGIQLEIRSLSRAPFCPFRAVRCFTLIG
jgi:hypothetical protein